jgi:two-component system response regulator NreC
VIPRIRVLLVDDNRDVTLAMRMLIEHEEDMECAGCIADADSVSDAADRLRPDVIVMDLSMPGRDPLGVVGELHASMPDIKTIVYSGHDASDVADRAIEAGAWGYVRKTADTRDLLESIRAVAHAVSAAPGHPAALAMGGPSDAMRWGPSHRRS